MNFYNILFEVKNLVSVYVDQIILKVLASASTAGQDISKKKQEAKARRK